MADVKWIKITTDIFDDEKILLIESLPDSYAIITVWFKLLCLAGKQNNSGVFMMGRVAYTDKMLATIFRMKESTVTMALQTFEQFGMIEIIDGVITIPNWGKHQNLDQLESKKEYMRGYMREYREKQKRLLGNSKLCENGLPLSEWSAVLDFFNHECAYCGAKDGLEQEHIIPVNDGGTYRIGNIVPSCRKCNASKGAKSVDGWYGKSDAFDPDRLQKINLYRCKTNIRDLHKTNVSQADKEEDKEREREGDIEESVPQKRKRFVPPTLEEVKAYCQERNNGVDAERFIDYYTSNGWLVGKNKMKDWKAAVRTWERKDGKKQGNSSFDVDDFFQAAMSNTYGSKKAADSPRTALDRATVARMEENSQKAAKTAAEDEDIQRRAEELRRQFAGGA